MKATFVKRRSEATNIITFWFKPEQKLDYLPGQYTELTIKHSSPDNRGEHRWFTLSSSPNQENISITTKFSTPGSSFKRALLALKPGQQVDLASPMGDFVLPKDSSIPLVFVAGGIGQTPFHSMFRWLADTGEKRDIKFIHAVRTEDNIIFQDVANLAGVNSIVVVSEPSSSWGGERDHVSAETILGIEKLSNDTLIYLSGPEPMLESLEKDLIKHGIDKKQLITDFFPGYKNI